MTVEIAAKHLPVLGPTGERDRRAVDADEAFAIVANEGEQVSLLRCIHIEVAVGEEDNRVEGVQVLRLPLERLLGDGGAVSPQLRVPKSRAASEIVKRCHCRGDGFVLVAFSLSDEQEIALWFFGCLREQSSTANQSAGEQQTYPVRRELRFPGHLRHLNSPKLFRPAAPSGDADRLRGGGLGRFLPGFSADDLAHESDRQLGVLVRKFDSDCYTVYHRHLVAKLVADVTAVPDL